VLLIEQLVLKSFVFKNTIHCFSVASVIDIGELIPSHTVDTKGQYSGFVVSHSNYIYGHHSVSEFYRGSINSTLTLTNLDSNTVEIFFDSLDLDFSNSSCLDHLNIRHGELHNYQQGNLLPACYFLYAA